LITVEVIHFYGMCMINLH